MIRRKPTSRFVLFTFTFFLLLFFTLFVTVTATADSTIDSDNDDELEELIAIDEQREAEDQQQQGELQKEAEVLSKTQRIVLELNFDNAKRVINENEYAMILGYAPWCPRSAELMPQFAEAANMLKELESTVLMAKLDAERHPKAASMLDIKGFPTLLLFVNGSSMVYTGGFTAEDIVIWTRKKTGASRPYKAEITVKSFSASNVYVGEGTDFSGVPTKMLTVNGSLRMSIYNPSTIFGIHVTSSPINLIYSEIPVATGQLKKYYQPRKSRRTVSVIVEGDKVPLYGAGSNLTVSQTGTVSIPLELKFEIKSRGNVVGKLVRTKHRKQISCPVVIDSTSTKPIKFKKGACTYD